MLSFGDVSDNKMNKLQLGCGLDYKQGWTNVDFNKEIKADIYCDFEKKLPFKKNQFDYILFDGTIEHLTPKRVVAIMGELHNIVKPLGIIDIYAPHYSSIFAFSLLTHFTFFGIGKFDSFTDKGVKSGERYSKARFEIEEKLLFFMHNYLPFPNWIFNFGRYWQRIMERFQLFGFDEIHYKLKVIK